MDDQQIQEAFTLALELTKQCGPIVLQGFLNSSKVVSTKGVHWDLVTQYDRQVEDVLIKGLKKRYPRHRMLGEESSTEADRKKPLDDRPTWIIDPIDGTVNFVRGLKFIAISVALVVAKELKIGIVYNPCMDELYTAIAGKGAFLDGKPIKVSGTKDLKKALIGNESSIASLEAARPYVLGRSAELIQECIGLRALGSAALSLAYIASGKLDGYCIEYLKPWDIAAGAILIREAGGVVMNINGNEYDILKPDIIAASSERLAQRLLEVVRKVSDNVDQKKSK